MKNTRGLSAVIVTLLLIMLSLVLVGIVWAVISNIVSSGTKQTSFQFGSLFLSLKLQKVKVDPDTGDISVVVQREVGQGELTGVAFVISDGVENVLVKKSASIQELGSKRFTITSSDLGDVSFAKSIQIAPILATSGGDQVGREVDEMKSDYPSSCLNALKSGDSHGDGIYTIDPDGLGLESDFKVYCDMTTDGGGWTLLMKATRGTTFNYNSNYWTTSNTLNEGEINRNDGDAKFRTFNELAITDIMARWPDAGDIIWLRNSAWESRTALQGFDEYRNWGIPQNQPDWNPTYFSAQAEQCSTGPGAYGTKLKDIGGYNAGARWGYRFNENGCGDWSSDDVGGGIGLVTSRSASWEYSAGDWYSCCGSEGAERSARVEVYGR